MLGRQWVGKKLGEREQGVWGKKDINGTVRVDSGSGLPEIRQFSVLAVSIPQPDAE